MSDEVETLGALIPFSQNFSEISVRQKMEHVSSVRPTGKFPEKVENLKRWARFPGWNFPNGISCSIYTFLVLYTSFNCYQLGSHLGVPSGNGLSAVPGFTIKWNNFLPIGKNPFLFPLKFWRIFYLTGKRPLSPNLLEKLQTTNPLPPPLPPRPTTTATFRYIHCLTNGHAN